MFTVDVKQQYNNKTNTDMRVMRAQEIIDAGGISFIPKLGIFTIISSTDKNIFRVNVFLRSYVPVT